MREERVMHTKITIAIDPDQMYHLSNEEPGKLWLVNADSEGMTITEEELYRMLDQYFRENF